MAESHDRLARLIEATRWIVAVLLGIGGGVLMFGSVSNFAPECRFDCGAGWQVLQWVALLVWVVGGAFVGRGVYSFLLDLWPTRADTAAEGERFRRVAQYIGEIHQLNRQVTELEAKLRERGDSQRTP